MARKQVKVDASSSSEGEEEIREDEVSEDEEEVGEDVPLDLGDIEAEISKRVTRRIENQNQHSAWGSQRGVYYQQQTSKDKEAGRLEEEAALLAQMEQKKKLHAVDYFDDADLAELLKPKALKTSKTTRGVHDEADLDKEEKKSFLKTRGDRALLDSLNRELASISSSNVGVGSVERIEKDLSMLSKEEKLQAISNESPELLGLIEDFKEKLQDLKEVTLPTLRKIENHPLVTDEGKSFLHTKFHLLVNYLMNISFLITLRCEGRKLHEHPIIQQLLKAKVLLERLSNLQSNIEPEIQGILGLSEEELMGGFEQAEHESGEESEDEEVEDTPSSSDESEDEDEPQNIGKLANQSKLALKSYEHDFLQQLGGDSSEHKNNNKRKRDEEKPQDKTKNFEDYLQSMQERQAKRTKKSETAPVQEDDESENDDVSADSSENESDKEAAEFYKYHEALEKQKQQRQKEKASMEQLLASSDANEADDTAEAPSVATKNVQERRKRKATQRMLKNKGLTSKKKQIHSNARAKLKHKYERAVERRAGSVRKMRDRSAPYGGEKALGINKNLVRSHKLV